MISFCVSGTRGAWRFCLRGRKIHTKIGSRKRESREGIALEELDLKYLQYALAVVRYGSVTQAARALYLAQPNLSRAIGELEQSLGFPLFLRTRQGMSLTPQGERFLTEVETLLDRLSDLARECRQESRRRVHFACVPSSLFVNTVLETARGLPDWSIQCEEYYDCRELFDRVGKGASLAAFLTFGTEMREELFAYFARRNLRYHPLAQSPAYGVVRRTSSLYHPETVPPSAASAPLRGAVPVHPVQQPPVRAEGGTGAELKRNIKRGRADPGVHPGVPRRLFCFGRCRPTTQGGGRRRSGGRGSSDNALFPPCGDLLRCKAEGLVDLIVVLAQQGSAAPHIGVRL